MVEGGFYGNGHDAMADKYLDENLKFSGRKEKGVVFFRTNSALIPGGGMWVYHSVVGENSLFGVESSMEVQMTNFGRPKVSAYPCDAWYTTGLRLQYGERTTGVAYTRNPAAAGKYK